MPVTVNGEGPYRFVVDTAAPPTVIDTDLSKALGLSVRSIGQIGGAGEGRTPAAIVSGVKLEFGGLSIERGDMMSTALNRRLRGFSGREVQGLIGNDWISRRVVEIDYENSVLRIHDGEGWGYEGGGVVIPTRVRAYTFIDATLTPPGREPIPVRFAVDTGAGLGVALSTPFVDRHRLLEVEAPMIEAIVGYGLGGEVRHRVARFERLVLGDAEAGAAVERPVVALSQDRAGALASTIFDGIIGAEVLSKYTATFDGSGRRLILEKNASHGNPMEFDMSGLTLAGDGPPAGGAGDEDGAGAEGEGGRGEGDAGRGDRARLLRVMAITEGSPAAAADIRPGDLLLSVDGEPVTARDRDRVRALFRRDGEERTLKLRRDGETVTVRLRLKRMV